ncbi:hypothetical protein EDD21DRAFT_189235 [Dissophora ornata]|nr:hypothetical protein EDD21DRAFT_189235 [Dissophora ornata]
MADSSTNDTLGATEDRTPDQDYYNFWAHGLKPVPSYLFATCYLTFLCLVAMVMVYRVRTRLRFFACFISYIGLSIAVVGLLRVKYIITSNWFWAWDFLGENSGLVVIALTIVSVGAGFYPMAKYRTLLWRSAMGVIIAYFCVGLAIVAYYVQQKVVHHTISGPEVQELRDRIIDAHLYTASELAYQRVWEQSRGLIPQGDAAITGVTDWRQLAWAEQEMFFRPSVTIYLFHQIFTLITFLWATFYLFIPLVARHRQSPVGSSVDGDMMAIGVWYLGVLTIAASFYGILQITYFIKPEFIFEPQTQVLDLCLRMTIAPVYFLPAPKFLIQYYRQRFSKNKGGNLGGSGGGSHNRNRGSGNHQLQGSITASEAQIASHTSSVSPTTRVGSRVGTVNSNIPRDSLDADYELDIKHKDATASFGESQGGRLKIFHTRSRGLSAESSRVLNNDFESESTHSWHLSDDGGDSVQQYDSSAKGQRLSIPSPVFLDGIRRQSAQESERSTCGPYDPLQSDLPYIMDGPLKQKPELKEIKIVRNDYGAGSSITGTTGWEVGGYDSRGPGADKPSQAKDRPVPAYDGNIPTDIPVKNLTGLQRQLADYHSTILPQVIAYKPYHEDLATDESLGSKLKPSPLPDYDAEATRQSTGIYRLTNTSSNRQSIDVATPGKTAHARDLGQDLKSQPPMIDPLHWSVHSELPKSMAAAETAYGGNSSDNGSILTAKSHIHKPKEGFIAAFSKALHGGSSSHGKSSHSNDGNANPHDSKDRNHKNYKNRRSSSPIDGQSEVNQGTAAATVEELTQPSTDIGMGPYEYSDPYDDRVEFKRTQERHLAGNSSYQPNTHGGMENQGMARAATAAETKSLASALSSRGVSTPILGSAKSRESLSKNSTNVKDPYARPTSPGSRKNSKSSSRTTHSKSDAPYRASLDSPQTPTSDMSMNGSRLASSPIAEMPSMPTVIVKTSLSPPPRQRWQQSNSFKGPNAQFSTIDTSIATESGQMTGGPLSSASATNTSSLQSSPTAHSLSPIMQTQGSRGTSFDYGNDLWASRERDRSIPWIPPLSELGSRLNGDRHQQSIDNLASSYYKRAGDMNKQ